MSGCQDQEATQKIPKQPAPTEESDVPAPMQPPHEKDPHVLPPTRQLDLDDKSLPNLFSPAFGFALGAAQKYELMPLGARRTGVSKGSPVWRIELHGIAKGVPPQGYDIAGDTIIGRRSGGAIVDLDLDQYDGAKQGVSRRHAMLRPTERCLFLIDLGSTNGTMLNATVLGPGMARALAHNDSISFGSITCTVKIVGEPNDLKEQK
nr:FHA domain-containing protein [Anaerolineae bacterium]